MSGRHRADRDGARATPGLELGGDDRVVGRIDRGSRARRRARGLARGVGHVALAQRAADLRSLGRKAACSPSPRRSTRRSTLPMQKAQQVELGRDLGAADERHDRARRTLERRATARRARPASAARRRPAGDAPAPRSRRARDAPPKTRRRHRARRAPASAWAKAGSFASSPGWKRRFSRSATCRRPQARRRRALRLGADAILGEGDLAAAERRAQRPATTGRSDSAGSGLPLGRPKCDITMTAAPLRDQRLDGRRQTLDAGRVADLAVLDRHVEIGAQQHPLAAHVDVVEGQEGLWHGSSEARRSVAALRAPSYRHLGVCEPALSPKANVGQSSINFVVVSSRKRRPFRRSAA